MAVPVADVSPLTCAPTTPTAVIAMPAHAQNGSRRQRRFHNGTGAPVGGAEEGSSGGRVTSLTGDRQCWDRGG